jgi:hypothetical protein
MYGAFTMSEEGSDETVRASAFGHLDAILLPLGIGHQQIVAGAIFEPRMEAIVGLERKDKYLNIVSLRLEGVTADEVMKTFEATEEPLGPPLEP